MPPTVRPLYSDVTGVISTLFSLNFTLGIFPTWQTHPSTPADSVTKATQPFSVHLTWATRKGDRPRFNLPRRYDLRNDTHAFQSPTLNAPTQSIMTTPPSLQPKTEEHIVICQVNAPACTHWPTF